MTLLTFTGMSIEKENGYITFDTKLRYNFVSAQTNLWQYQLDV